jgi:predicted DNA-binding transcriptional regulator YafY
LRSCAARTCAPYITPWLLGWGAAVEVLDPPELRDFIRQIATEMADRYLPVPS